MAPFVELDGYTVMADTGFAGAEFEHGLGVCDEMSALEAASLARTNAAHGRALGGRLGPMSAN